MGKIHRQRKTKAKKVRHWRSVKERYRQQKSADAQLVALFTK